MLNLLTLLFIALKLCGVISWSWLAVLSPTIVYVVFVFGLILLAAVLAVFGNTPPRRFK